MANAADVGRFGKLRGLLGDNFNVSPFSIDLIEKNLYLGSLRAAKDVNALTKYQITHILTIEDCPLPPSIRNLKNITCKYIPLSDLSSEDILSHFDESDAFIKDGLSKGAVLVHCLMGASRSATLVIAFLMKKHNLNYQEAFKRVSRRRSVVRPNDGFVFQLKLYEEMGYKLDPDNKNYKLFLLSRAGSKIKSQNFPEHLIRDDSVDQTNPDLKVFSCKKCQTVLASEDNQFTHKTGGGVCEQLYFIEPFAWMHVKDSVQNKLECPKCSTEVGYLNWKGRLCLCGVKIMPAFWLTPFNVEFGKIRKTH